VAEIIYLNGELIPRSEAKLSPFDRGFLYGYGLFETMRAYRAHIFRLDRHLTRLRRSARDIGLAYSVLNTSSQEQSLETACLKTLSANKLEDARLRLTISAGEGDMVPDLEAPCNPTVLIAVQKLVALPSEKYESGFKASLSSSRRNSQSPLSRLKSACYVENILARRAARAVGCDEAILLNEQNYLTEGSMTNIFLADNGELITPSLESGALPGITREAVLEMARTSNIKVLERQVELKELIEAEEAFVTNSILEIMPVTWFEGKPIGTGKPGRLTRELMSAYGKLVDEAVESDRQ
jgi:branched-chain amino acid aminotransferase